MCALVTPQSIFFDCCLMEMFYSKSFFCKQKTKNMLWSLLCVLCVKYCTYVTLKLLKECLPFTGKLLCGYTRGFYLNETLYSHCFPNM